MRCKRIVLIVNWLKLFVQEVDGESLELWWLLEKPAFQEVGSDPFAD